MNYRVGFYHDVFREELLEKIRAEHPHGLLVCFSCGWSWLTMEDAQVKDYGFNFLGVVKASNFRPACLDEHACVRRQEMRMRTVRGRKRIASIDDQDGGRKDDNPFRGSSLRRAVPICGHDTITQYGITRGPGCTCQFRSQ